MKLALLTRVGTTETLEAHIEFHLGAGVDVIFLSGSSAVPEAIARNPGVQVVESFGEVEKAGADWVIESGANEFWWPHGGSLKQLLELVGSQYGSVQALPRSFVPVADTDLSFSERMVHRFVHGRPERRLIRRATASERNLAALRGWFPIEVLRYPLGKVETGTYDDEALQRGVDAGVLEIDPRVRDALRTLAAGRAVQFPRMGVVEEARFASDFAAVGQVDLVQARERLDELELRLAAVEATFGGALKRKLRALRGRA